MSRTNSPDSPLSKSEDSEQNRDVNALFSSFRLDQAGYRTFGRHRPSSSRPLEHEEQQAASEPQHHPRVQIAVFSPMGGSGKSMLTANLASIFWQLGKSVLLVDASPWPTLAFHYGATSSRPGIRSFFAPGENEIPVRILARDPNETSIPNIDHYVANTAVDYVLLDLSGVPANELSAYLKDCQVLLVPLLPTSSATRYAEAVHTFLESMPNPPEQVKYIVNQMDESRLAKEACTSLAQLLGDQLFQKPIQRQPEIQEALAEGIVLPLYAPKAQAVAVCNEIARWLELPKSQAVSKGKQRWSER